MDTLQEIFFILSVSIGGYVLYGAFGLGVVMLIAYFLEKLENSQKWKGIK